MASQMCNKWKKTIGDKQCFSIAKHSFCLKNMVYRGKLSLSSKKHSFSIYYTSGADELCLLQRNSVFRSKNIVFLKTMFFVDKLCLSP